ncbi:MAG: hypothetical protein KAQ65_00975 [Candidatus Thorarchaeota archaeon]|nr:hypothetical protein [Candidatus Thorarchaeota archaeon]MCK5239564.1 hypothetical protein [Candidatus Thorarchaeota archaeon]
MADKPIDLIEKYLERVKIYLPLGSEDIIAEIRTHLIEEAENLGRGEMSHGSAMLAIERFGDPKDAAHEWAGTGKKVGPVPAEYATPLVKIALTLIALGAIFIVGASIVSYAVPGFWGMVTFQYSIAMMVVMSLIYAFIIIGGLSYFDDKKKPPTEKTTLESVLGVASGAFKPKPRSDAAAGFFFGLIFAAVVISPFMQSILTAEALLFVNVFVILLFVEAIVNLMFFLFGENNVNLSLEAIVGGAWIVFSMFLINIAFPVIGVYSYSDSMGWTLMTFEELSLLIPEVIGWIPLNLIWVFIVFIIVITNLWTVLMASMKIPMYRQAGKGWWWQGEWGQKRWKKYRKSKRPYRAPAEENGYSSPNY